MFLVVTISVVIDSILVWLTFLTAADALVLLSNTSRGAAAASSVHVPEYMPWDILEYYDEYEADSARRHLLIGVEKNAHPVQMFDYERCHRSDASADAKRCLNSNKESVFEAANVSFSLPNKFMTSPKGHAGPLKNVLRLGKGADHNCVVYSAGISDRHAEDTWFEESMVSTGCEVHAFDCTISKNSSAVRDKKFFFHKWCVGSQNKVNFTGNIYTNGNNLVFKTLDMIAAELGHPKIDIFKMDIEGFEYDVIENEILKGSNLPIQLAFELHTEEASTRFVPEANTKGKDYTAVNRLFLKLFDAGYRVISKQINSGDPACAEYVTLNVDYLLR